jgi:hypothetical protein
MCLIQCVSVQFRLLKCYSVSGKSVYDLQKFFCVRCINAGRTKQK